MAGGRPYLIHLIFQRHDLPPDEFYAKDVRTRRFMLVSENIERERRIARGEEW